MAGAACPEEFLQTAERLVAASGPILRQYFRARIDVDIKADASPVTRADRESETAMRRLIETAHPEHGILGEEYEAVRPDAEYLWVLDPLDGTKAFITGKPLFGTLVALLRAGVPILGVIDAPVLDERWIGAAGRPTTFNGAPVRTRQCGAPGEAMLNTTTPDMFEGADAEAFARLRGAVRGTHFGGDCYGYALLASGFLDLVVEAKMKPFDYLPLVAVVEGAGGRITDWAGRTLGLQGDGRVLAAATPALHAAAAGLLAGAAA